MKGIAVTDHGDMFGIKEFFNYVNKKNSSTNSEIKDLKKRIAGLEKGTVECDNPETELVACKENWKRQEETCLNRFSVVRCMWRASFIQQRRKTRSKWLSLGCAC